LLKLLGIVVGVGALGIVVGATLGPWAGQLLFGDKFNLSNQDLALLCAGSACFILALTLAQALIALLGHGRALMSWIVGLVICVGVMAAGSSATTSDLFLRSELGYLAGCAAAAVVMAIFLLASVRSQRPESLSLLVEAIEHEPLEI
jgi:O-antigen/teichoic acid export membrane protein